MREAPGYDAASTIRYTGKHAFVNDNRPPRIIFGMKVKTFLMVAAVMTLVVVGAAVGGAVGGKNMRENQDALGVGVGGVKYVMFFPGCTRYIPERCMQG